MKRLVLGLVLAIGVSFGAAAQEARDAITGVIQRQIDAFLVDDFATAFSFASPAIKGMFGSPERFGQMVRNGYPMVWRPGNVQFLDLEEIDGRLWQRVYVTDQAGVPYMLGYQMIQTENGWQINGVEVIRAPQVGA